MGRILALDYGKKRTGVAVTDALRLIASGLETVATSELLPWLDAYLAAEAVDLIVIGEPRRMDNRPSEVEADIQDFIARLLKRQPGVQIARQDERFTSKMAARALVEGGMKKKKRREKAVLDEVSATLILQSYLSSNNL
ncbi:Holliday junction resolvase RuvX [Robiginitalea sp. M366]|uniref:Holliday junction resolvase RuvX n=1 Tax=Robiginitalea aestuariiviva TaxID=3036903 RepID=UPI00240DF360|nr:Holliday junction resolvase RuvX [Robiginitalea aestuariiviva]MDG1572368.1 Holliday junction resolvase RuvX [Robiginitalea aestuariiviva]